MKYYIGQKVRIKTMDECYKQGFITDNYFNFCNVTNNPGINSAMNNLFGGIYTIRSFYLDQLVHMNTIGAWSWPIEIIEPVEFDIKLV